MDAKFIPGPWVQCGLSGNWPDESISIKHCAPGVDGAIHAIVNVLNGTEEARQQAKANARLIAAAPDLLEALDNVTACLETLMAHFENKMPDSDRHGRNNHITVARKLIARVVGVA